MSTGWPQNQQELRRPHPEDDDRPAAAQAGQQHPSGPLPVGRGRSGSGRGRGRGRGRDAEAADETVEDADYDWIKYLGAAGPAQESSRRTDLPSGPPRPAGRPQPSPEPWRTAPGADDGFGSRSGSWQTTPRRPADGPGPGGPRHGLAGPPGGLPRRGSGSGPQLPPPAVSRPGSGSGPQLPPPAALSRPGSGPERALRPDRGPDTGPLASTPPAAPPDRRGAGRMVPGRLAASRPAAPATDVVGRPAGPPSPAAQPADYRPAAPDRQRQTPDRDALGPPPAAIRDRQSGQHPASSQPAPTRQSAPSRQKPAARPGRRSRKSAAKGSVLPAAASSPTAGIARPAAAVAVKSPPARTAAPPAGRRPKPRRRALRRPRTYVALVCVLGAGAAGALYLMPKGSQAHAISAPPRLPGYVLEPSMVASTGASALRDHLVASSAGEATRVIDAVYEDTAGASGNAVPQIVVFVGGHLAGSASSFIDGLTQALPGAVTVSPGSLHGQAACAPSRPGRPAECAWADNDTFGVLVSPGLTATQLSAELRLMRPYIEHVVR